jgi:hypothetical protein
MRHSCWRYHRQPEAVHGFYAARPRAGGGLLLFPELSLTGYEATLAKALAQDIDRPLLSPLRHFAREASMTTVVGLPLRLPRHDKPQLQLSYSTETARLVPVPSSVYTLAKSNSLVREPLVPCSTSVIGQKQHLMYFTSDTIHLRAFREISIAISFAIANPDD